MSYILDALRRAEADRERERGQVPGLHTRTLSGSDAASAAGKRRWGFLAAGGLLLLAGLGAGSWWAGSAPQAPPPAPHPQPAPVPVVAAVVPPPPAASGSPYLPPAPPPAVAVPAREPAASEARIPWLSELPESLRRELPKLAISGSVYAEDPAARFLIVNGEVQREGARLAPELVLEQIQPHELVLRFRGQRYRQAV